MLVIYMKNFICILFVTIYCFCIVPSVQASYMLPYPSAMPGNKVYRINRIIDSLKNYWYIGNIAQLKYHLALADKYLVEAKTLMAYQQYLLGKDALIRSDIHFAKLVQLFKNIQADKKDTIQFQTIIQEATDTHILTLNVLQSNTPEDFIWSPEKTAATQIPIHELLRSSKQIRMSTRFQIEELSK